MVSLKRDADVGVIQSKDWFEWDDASKPLQAGTSLIFCVQSRVMFKDKTSYHDVSVSGDVFICDQLKRLVKVGSVDFEQDNCQGNPVVTYLQWNGAPQGLVTLLPNDGYNMTSSEGAVSFNSPLTNDPYLNVSGDFNPIHVNPYFSNYASLPGTITHGMWSSAATHKYVEDVVAHGHSHHILS